MNVGRSVIISRTNCGLIHRVQIPDEVTFQKRAPVIVMVHGWGGDENVMWVFKKVVPPGTILITPRAILENDEGGYYWFKHSGKYRINPDQDSLEEALYQLHCFIKNLADRYPVDLNRLVLMGFSQGAAMCNSMALMWPDAIIGVASIAGAMPDLPDIVPYPDLLTGLPVFLAHGTRDETVPLHLAYYTRDTYQQLGADVMYGEYSVGHKMSIEAMKDLRRWLAKVIADSVPKDDGRRYR